MRASLGFRAGPLRVSTGNLLKSSRRRSARRGGALEAVFAWPVIITWLMIKYGALLMWWALVGSGHAAVWLWRRYRPTDATRPTAATTPQDRRP